MKKIATYTLRRASAGRGHFARVTVAPTGCSDATIGTDEYMQWKAAANDGLLYALRQLESDASVCVTAIEATDVDTRADTVFVAAAMATFELLGDNSYSTRFNGERWVLQRQQGNGGKGQGVVY